MPDTQPVVPRRNVTQTLRFGSLDPQVFRRAWGWGIVATMFCMIYTAVCIDTPRIKFLTACGFTAFHFGIVAGLASLTLVFQLISGCIVRYLKWRKPFWFVTVLTQRLIFSFVIAAPFIFGAGTTACIWFIIFILFLHDAAGNLSGPPWLSWMADIVPRDSMNTVWGRRLRLLTIAQIAGTLLAAFMMQYFETRGELLIGYVYLGAIGVAAGVTDILLFNAKVPENYHFPDRSTGLWTALMEPLRDRSYRPFFVFLIWWYFAMMLAGPFFVVYLVRSMEMPIMWVQLTTVSSLVGVAIGGPIFGLIADAYGPRPLMRFFILMKIVSLLPYVFIPHDPRYYWMFPACVWLDGMLNAGLVLSFQNTMFACAPQKSRTMYIGVTQFIAMGIAGGIAPFLSGTVIDMFEESGLSLGAWNVNIYHFMFILSLFLRLGCLPLANKLPSTGGMGMGAVLTRVLSANTARMAGWLVRLSVARSAAGRARACGELGVLRNPMSVAALMQQLGSKDFAVRHAAAHALGAIGSDKASATLAQVMYDEDKEVSAAAAQSLGQIGGRDSLRYLLKSLNRADRATVLATVDSLGLIGDDAAILPLVCMMQDAADDPVLRESIAGALRRITRDGDVNGGQWVPAV